MGKDGAIKKLISKTLEQMLEAELTEHLALAILRIGYDRYSPEGRNSGNSINSLPANL